MNGSVMPRWLRRAIANSVNFEVRYEPKVSVADSE